MGVCLCKDQEELPTNNGLPEDTYIGNAESSHRFNHSKDRKVSLSETVDILVEETLEVIGSIVEK